MRFPNIPARVIPALVLVLLACGGDKGRWAAFIPPATPAEHQRGERLFNTYCLSCHGRAGKGDGLGPPMLDTLFHAPTVPGSMFRVSVRTGAKQKYYNFGAMPPLNRVSDVEVEAIRGYVRWVQGEGDAWARTQGGAPQ